ncbi:folylpolyglutamate synthase/dihydrofolate synthase family protein [Lishizhenia sp.]|uniref:bifunctional folylpolyglutamate synthase/dihydrofolate synthase n=1 Tax=Lishizhenia sp. TaxID=2497594 RepID=UPI00299F1406|nr:folylpolyglutamate synthase/dihydrofolate synthase family protein [Lishizhenia sp.]MDX1445571.1 folylpolyglutamate synthase/dihydrofolate synthase family protein [Lishizhenia sp.]
MTYQETIDWLFQQFPSYQNIGAKAYKPDLYNVEKLCAIFNNPQNDIKTIHVAGTNGKGSTCSYISSFLTEAGYKVGLFTSPHLQRFTERIRINGEEVKEDFVVDFVAKVKAQKLDYSPSFFEITFVMALEYFKQEQVDFAVIETGLGGRLDATNIISPILSVITNIGLEHTNFLGTTIKEIAAEKGGIIKRETPVVLGTKGVEVVEVMEKIAKEKEAALYFSNEALDTPSTLLANYLQENYRTAHKAIEVLVKETYIQSIDVAQNFAKALQNLYVNTGLRGRMHLVQEQPRIIFDAAHNADGIKNLLSNFNEEGLLIVYGSSNDKDFESIFPLFPKNATYFLSEFKNERSAKIELLEQNATKNGLNAKYFKKVSDALTEAQNTAGQEDTILCFGSFFLLENLYEIF